MDLKGLAADIGLDEEEMLELVELFFETSISDLERLKKALDQNDAMTVAEAAHSIKGASGNMRFEEIYELARQIEKNANKKILDGVMANVASIDQELQKISTFIARITR
jgi:HPt (histidine-containing phosphotransfer) domain-containing protein